jgi:hypothetical protein
MRKYYFFIFAILFNSVSAFSQILIIKNTNVVDVKAGAVIKNMSVVIEGNRIKDILKDASKYKGQTVDGTNKYLIPGLWDMHTHNWTAEQFFPLLLANGVTGIRDMFGSMDSIHKWRKSIQDGNILGPVIYASGPIVDGPKPVWPGSVAVSKPEQVAAVVDSVKNKLKVDFIKVYSLLPRDVYFKIAEEAKKQGIAFEGHIPNEVYIVEGAKAGQKSQEHLTNLIQESSDSADYFMKVNQKLITDTTMRNPVIKLGIVLRTFNPKKLDAIISDLAKYGSWICPTLTVNRSIGRMRDSSFTSDPRVHYMMPGIAARWNPANDFRFKALTDEYFQIHQKILALQLTAIKKMQDAGVKLLAGTDFPNPYCFPGFSLHDELQLMVKAGLTPLQALQTATLNPALFFEITNDYGTVEKGKVANLVLLDKNPLENIDNTRKIESVFINGKMLGKETLQQMMQKLWHE